MGTSHVSHTINEDSKTIKIKKEDRIGVAEKYNKGGVTQEELAEEYGVTQSCISYLLTMFTKAKQGHKKSREYFGI